MFSAQIMKEAANNQNMACAADGVQGYVYVCVLVLKKELTHFKYVLTFGMTASQFCLQRKKDNRHRFFFLSATLLFAFCCNNSSDRKIEVVASDKGQKINIQRNQLFSEDWKKNHVAQMIRAVLLCLFVLELDLLCLHETGSACFYILHCLLPELFVDACMELTSKPATCQTRTREI